jgi:hypothetical protein
MSRGRVLTRAALYFKTVPRNNVQEPPQHKHYLLNLALLRSVHVSSSGSGQASQSSSDTHCCWSAMTQYTPTRSLHHVSAH